MSRQLMVLYGFCVVLLFVVNAFLSAIPESKENPARETNLNPSRANLLR